MQNVQIEERALPAPLPGAAGEKKFLAVLEKKYRVSLKISIRNSGIWFIISFNLSNNINKIIYEVSILIFKFYFKLIIYYNIPQKPSNDTSPVYGGYSMSINVKSSTSFSSKC